MQSISGHCLKILRSIRETQAVNGYVFRREWGQEGLSPKRLYIRGIVQKSSKERAEENNHETRCVQLIL